MKKNLLSSLIISTFALSLSTSAFADQPEWAGNGKATAEQKQEHKSAMQEKRGPYQKNDKQKLKNQEHYDEHHNERYENHHEERHDNRYENHHEERHDKRYEEDHEERYGEHHDDGQPIETDKQPNPDEDNRSFQQRMKDLFGW